MYPEIWNWHKEEGYSYQGPKKVQCILKKLTIVIFCCLYVGEVMCLQKNKVKGVQVSKVKAMQKSFVQ